MREAGLDPSDPLLARCLELTHELIGFPRHLSQHVGGFVLTRGPLSEVVPIGNAAMEDRTVIEWDKDDLDALGLLKVDVLGFGMLTCIRKAFALLKAHYGKDVTLGTVPRDDPAVYDMLCRADSIGVFQVESRAQMNMLPRLKPRCFYDLVIEVAIVRPGPIQGDMVHPYLRRRSGAEPVEFPSPHPDHGPQDELHQVLGKTMGVPLFQEQAMRLAMVAAKFSGPEANELRRAMATFRRRGTIGKLQGQDGRPHDGARLSGRFRRALLQPDQGLRRIWLPREPRRELRASGLCLGLAQMPLPGGVRLRAAQCPAHGLLCPGADRALRPRAWRRGARGRRQSQPLGLHARTRRREGCIARCASACARSTACAKPTCSARLIRDGSPRELLPHLFATTLWMPPARA